MIGVDTDIMNMMDKIPLEETFSDKKLNDDYNQTNDYIKENHPIPHMILNNLLPLVVEKYIQPAFPDNEISVKHFRLNQGQTHGNTKWHNDRLDSDGNKDFKEANIIFLYYFNTLDLGPLCLKNGKGTYEIYPKKGTFVIINEVSDDIKHKIQAYEETMYGHKVKRYTARIGFKVD